MPKKRLQTVGSRIISHYSFLKKLASTKSEKKRRKLLADINPDQLLAIVECASNILSWKFKLSKRQRNKLLPFAPTIRQLGRVRTEKGARQIVQNGGGIAALGALLGPVLVDAAYHLIQKYV